MILVKIWGYILSKEDKTKKALGSPGWRNFILSGGKVWELEAGKIEGRHLRLG